MFFGICRSRGCLPYGRLSSAATGGGSSASLARASRAARRNDGGRGGPPRLVSHPPLAAGAPLRSLVPRALRCGMTAGGVAHRSSTANSYGLRFLRYARSCLARSAAE
ncbi:MAG: hypothetical protein LBH84_09260 [Prevotellaceae bacterium]|nr:hypothetical protein [Prevotellaceae bacterium]